MSDQITTAINNFRVCTLADIRETLEKYEKKRPYQFNTVMEFLAHAVLHHEKEALKIAAKQRKG